MNVRNLVSIVVFACVSASIPGSGALAQDEAWDGRFGAPGLSAPVFALAKDGNSVYAGGAFTTAGGAPANRIARWDGGSWLALGDGVSGEVYAVAVSGTDVYVGGAFTTAGGAPANRIARWDGSAWSALGTGLSGDVLAIAVDGGDVYVGGRFTTAGGQAALRVAKWDGSVWSALGGGVSNDVNAIAVDGGNVYVGGTFTTAGGAGASRIAVWDGSAWSALGSGVSGAVNAIAVSGSDIYVGGDFTTAGGAGAFRVARWDGADWTALGGGVSSVVSALDTDGQNLYVAGAFTTADGLAAARIAVWDGSTWSALGSGTSDAVLAVRADGGDVYAGGVFTTAGAKASFYFGRWNPAIVAVHITRFLAIADPSGVRLEWNLFADEPVAEIRVYRGVREGNGFETVGRLDATAPQPGIYLDTGVEPGTTYLYMLGVARPDGSEVRSLVEKVTTGGFPLRLGQNHPNPFNPSTLIRFTVPEPTFVRLTVIDVRGREVASLLAEIVPAGVREVLWDGRDANGNSVGSGVYFSRLYAGKRVLTRKMVLLK
jgi:hypothetical protein